MTVSQLKKRLEGMKKAELVGCYLQIVSVLSEQNQKIHDVRLSAQELLDDARKHAVKVDLGPGQPIVYQYNHADSYFLGSGETASQILALL